MIIEIFISAFFIYIVFPQKQLIGLVSGQLNCCILLLKHIRTIASIYDIFEVKHVILLGY